MGTREFDPDEVDPPQIWYALEGRTGLVRLELRRGHQVTCFDTLPVEALPASKREELVKRREILAHVVSP